MSESLNLETVRVLRYLVVQISILPVANLHSTVSF